MLPEELELKIDELRKKPLKVFCKKRNGDFAIMTVHNCIKSGSSYISIAADEIDALLSKHLEERTLHED